MRKIERSNFFCASTALSTLAMISLAAANPLDGKVTAGTANISSGANTVTINQQSQNAIIDWRSFNIGIGETTRFVQPSSTSTTLNRVTGGEGPSSIFGTLTANGRVFIVNPDGILFGKGSQVNVGGLLATTHDISNSDFMAGHYNFTIPGNPNASIVNEGTISAERAGFAALVAPGVRNSGTITANLGTVALGAGDGVTLDFYGDQLVNLKLNGSISGEIRDVATGQLMSSAVSNSGKLRANGGTVEMTATTARKVVDSVINNVGVIEANSVRQKNGTIILTAATVASKDAGAPVQIVKVSGIVSAQGKKGRQTGGKIQITGENIAVNAANLNASGRGGGGSILVGGDYMGGNPAQWILDRFNVRMEATPIPTSSAVKVDSLSTLSASAMTNGNGGKVVVWSDNTTSFAGIVQSRGGTLGGNGGFVEVSGKQALEIAGLRADLKAPAGLPGRILFDPTSVIVDATFATTIESVLNAGGDAIVTASQDITIGSNILKTAGGDSWLEFYAGQGISILPNVVIGSSSGKLNVWLEADASNAALFSASNSPNLPSGLTPTITTVLTGVATADLEPVNFPVGTPTGSRNLSRDGQDLVSNAPPASSLPSYLSSSYQTALTNLQMSTLTVDPSVRFYLNGGTISTWGNNYKIANSQYVFRQYPAYNGTIDAFTAFNAIGADISAAVACTGACGTNYLEAADNNFNINNPGAPIVYSNFRADAVSYSVNRSQTLLPTGVVSSAGLPGLVPVSSSARIPLSADQLTAIASNENLTTNLFTLLERRLANIEPSAGENDSQDPAHLFDSKTIEQVATSGEDVPYVPIFVWGKLSMLGKKRENEKLKMLYDVMKNGAVSEEQEKQLERAKNW